MTTYIAAVKVPESVKAFFAALAPLGVVTYNAPSTRVRVLVADTDDLYDLAMRARDVEVALAQVVGSRFPLPRPTDPGNGNGLVYLVEPSHDVRAFFDHLTGLAAVPDFTPGDAQVGALFDAEDEYELGTLVAETISVLESEFGYGEAVVDKPQPLAAV